MKIEINTEKLKELVQKIRNLTVMSSDLDCDKMESGFKSLIMEMKKELIGAIHNTAIIPPKEEGGLWRTTVYKEDSTGKKKRKDIRSRSLDGLYDKLYNYYVGPGTLQSVFDAWSKQREDQENLAPATISRDKERWYKYFHGTELSEKRIDTIDNLIIERHLYALIKRDHLKVKELNEVKSMLKKVFDFAVHNHQLSISPIPFVVINKTGCEPAPPKDSKKRIYLKEEISLMQKEIAREVMEIPNSSTALSISLLFILGVRVGELVALRESDIDWSEGTIHIRRMECKGKSGSIIVNHTKKKNPDGDRYLPLGESGRLIVNQVLDINKTNGYSDEDFLFLGEHGKRIHIRAVDNRIRKLCKRAGIIPAKSAHDIRRTTATQLYRQTHDIEMVRKFLGHSDVKTTWGYIVDIDAEKEDRKKIIEALQGFGIHSSIMPTSGQRNSGKVVNISSIRQSGRCHTGATHFSEKEKAPNPLGHLV